LSAVALILLPCKQFKVYLVYTTRKFISLIETLGVEQLPSLSKEFKQFTS